MDCNPLVLVGCWKLVKCSSNHLWRQNALCDSICGLRLYKLIYGVLISASKMCLGYDACCTGLHCIACCHISHAVSMSHLNNDVATSNWTFLIQRLSTLPLVPSISKEITPSRTKYHPSRFCSCTAKGYFPLALF